MRKDGWELMLHNYIEASRGLSFVWGENDCALWASSWVDLCTGSAHASEWAGLYDTEEGAKELMLERLCANVDEVATSILLRKSVKMAQRGDLVLFSGALGICDGRKSYFLTPEKGLVCVLTVQCAKAWAV